MVEGFGLFLVVVFYFDFDEYCEVEVDFVVVDVGLVVVNYFGFF